MRFSSEVASGQAGMGLKLGELGQMQGWNLLGVLGGKKDENAIAYKVGAEKAAKVKYAETLIARTADDGDVRYELVAKLRGEIAAGTYWVAAADVAEKLMGTMAL